MNCFVTGTCIYGINPKKKEKNQHEHWACHAYGMSCKLSLTTCDMCQKHEYFSAFLPLLNLSMIIISPNENYTFSYWPESVVLSAVGHCTSVVFTLKEFFFGKLHIWSWVVNALRQLLIRIISNFVIKSDLSHKMNPPLLFQSTSPRKCNEFISAK